MLHNLSITPFKLSNFSFRFAAKGYIVKKTFTGLKKKQHRNNIEEHFFVRYDNFDVTVSKSVRPHNLYHPYI